MAEADIARLEQRFQKCGRAKHADRWSHQQKGQAVYLIAWYQGQPVGHALLKWSGSQDEPVTRQFRITCPDVEGRFVLREYRSKGIGTQLLCFAERLARERSYTQIGLSVGVKTNERAPVV